MPDGVGPVASTVLSGGTLNLVVVQNGNQMGIHAPWLTDSDAAYAVAHHLALAHGLGVQAFRVGGVKGRIGPRSTCTPSTRPTTVRARAARLPSTTGTRTGSIWTRSSAAATPPTCWPISDRAVAWPR
jgi:hypothetical protein